MELLSSHRVFTTTDVDEASQFAGQIWERNRTSIVTGRYGLRWNQLNGDRIGWSYIEHDCTVDLKTEGPLSDHFRLFLHGAGSIEHSVGHRTFESGPGRVVAHAPGMDLGMVLSPCRFLLVTLDGAFVRRAIEQRFRKLPSMRDWLGSLPDTPNARSLYATASFLTAQSDSADSPLARPGKPRQHAERLLLSLVMECLSEAAPLKAERAEDLGVLQVRMAEEWIDAHLTEAIGVEEIAAAVGVGVRSLQMSFKKVRGMSPREVIMRRRLERARTMLLTREGDTTVTNVAMSLGFFELGRFAQRYRRRFGETPSMTLASGWIAT